MRVTFRFSQRIQYVFDFGKTMKGIYESVYWFTLIKEYYDENNDIEYAKFVLYI